MSAVHFALQSDEMLRTWLPGAVSGLLADLRRLSAETPEAAVEQASQRLYSFVTDFSEFDRTYARAAAPVAAKFLARGARSERTTDSGFDPDEGEDDGTEVEEELRDVQDSFLLLFLWLMLWGGADREQRYREWLLRRRMDLTLALRTAWAQGAGEAVDADARSAGQSAMQAELRRQAAPQGAIAKHADTFARTEFWIGMQAVLRAVAETNSGSFAGYRWTAVLDDRTCIRCAAMDGKFFPLDEPPQIPLHPRCRCLAVPVASRSAKNPPRGETFDSWLRRQPQPLQRELLGPDAEAFAAGKKRLGDFVSFRGRYAARRRRP